MNRQVKMILWINLRGLNKTKHRIIQEHELHARLTTQTNQWWQNVHMNQKPVKNIEIIAPCDRYHPKNLLEVITKIKKISRGDYCRISKPSSNIIRESRINEQDDQPSIEPIKLKEVLYLLAVYGVKHP